MPQAPAQRDSRQASDVAKLVRLHHRRRGWAFVATGSAIGFAGYAGIDVSLPGSRTGTAQALTAIPVFALLALAVAGVAVVIVDTSLIHRADAALQVTAKARVSHYPWYAHAHRWPPRHPGSWVAAMFMLLAMTTITVYIVPQEVNAWAYVVGAPRQDTFNPVSYNTSCSIMGRHGVSCQTVTLGYLSRSGTNVIWSSEVPLNRPFSVRDPLWAWDTGRILISGDGSATTTIIAGLFFDVIAILLLYVLVVLTRDTSPRRIQPRSTPAGADPDGLRRTHHPGDGHHGNRARRRARRGHRQRTARSR